MTLIISVISTSRVIQASDRRLTKITGGIYDDNSNKAIIVTCNDAHFAIGYCGYGQIPLAKKSPKAGKIISTDEWISDELTKFNAAGNDLASITKHIKSTLNSLKVYNKLNAKNDLTIVLCGFGWNDKPFFTRIPRLGNVFHRYYKKTTKHESVLDVQIDPIEWLGVFNSSIKDKLDLIKNPGYLASSSPEALTDYLVELIRQANQQLVEGEKIGRNCMTINITLSHGSISQYYNDGELSKVYAPTIINELGTFSGIEISGALALKGQGVAFGGSFLGKSDRVLFTKSQRAQSYFSIGHENISEGKFDQAINNFNSAIELEPNMAEAYNCRGIAYRNIGRYELAIEDFSAALDLDHSMAASYNNRGLSYFNIDDYDKALSDFSFAIQLYPSLGNAFYNRGNLYASIGFHEKAISDYDLAIKNNPSFSVAYNNRGLSYLELGDNLCAIEDFNKALELNEKLFPAYYNRGLAHQRLGELKSALSDLEIAITLQPDDTQLQNKFDEIKQAINRE